MTMTTVLRPAATLLTVLAASLAGACGQEERESTSDASASRAELGRSVTRVCSEYRADAGALPPRPDSPTEFETRLSRLQERALSRLQTLKPSDADADAFHAFVRAQEEAFDAQARLRASGRSGEGDSPPARATRQATDRAQRLAFRLGFDSCTSE